MSIYSHPVPNPLCRGNPLPTEINLLPKHKVRGAGYEAEVQRRRKSSPSYLVFRGSKRSNETEGFIMKCGRARRSRAGRRAKQIDRLFMKLQMGQICTSYIYKTHKFVPNYLSLFSAYQTESMTAALFILDDVLFFQLFRCCFPPY